MGPGSERSPWLAPAGRDRRAGGAAAACGRLRKEWRTYGDLFAELREATFF